MTNKITGFEKPTRHAMLLIGGLVSVMLLFANLLPVSAAAIGTEPGLLRALAQPAGAIHATPSPDLLLVRRRGERGHRGGGGRRAHRGGRGHRAHRGGGERRAYRGGGGHRRRHYGGPYIYYSIPYYGYSYYYGYYYQPYAYSYRRYGGSCEYWHRRCVANWGYRNPDYYGCMRYQGCR